jgi:5-methylthioadenosine/S-adenosylhomocysteine deaminase
MAKLYSARWVLPIASPTINDGAIAVEDSAIIAVGPRADVLTQFPDAAHEDFGNAAILPGLINTHSHLELTAMRGFLEREENDFFAWLLKLTLARFGMTDDDLFVSAACGAIEAARAGVTCLADASSLAANSMRALNEVGLRGIVYQESFGPDPKVAEDSVSKLRSQLDDIRPLQTELVRAGVSPHAPYTVSGRQLEMISQIALAESLPLMMHAAESQAEKQFMENGDGMFVTALKLRGIDWQAPGISTVRYLRDHGVLETKPLLAHCINVDQEDLDLIKASGAGIAHCPKSNAKLRHGHAPFDAFVANHLKVGLGSDSVASNNVCDILEEARFAAMLTRISDAATDEDTEVSATAALHAATLGGAQALGLEHQIGALQTGMAADVTVINLDGVHQQPVRDPQDALVFCSSGRDVRLTMVAGKEIYRNNCVVSIDEQDLRRRLADLANELDSDE